jgi:hypothetical protein
MLKGLGEVINFKNIFSYSFKKIEHSPLNNTNIIQRMCSYICFVPETAMETEQILNMLWIPK